ncbi:RNA cytidine acetyltransferase [Cloeon dipterum]|uniref:RNA cytidine acetyltransferase n=1 Tax=Cloeon dipterum TaxID=197152 RepID=UPI00321FE8EE
MVRKKIDNRIRLLIENGVKLGHRTMFAIVGDKGRDQVIILHHMLSKAAIKARPNVLWCYKKELGFSSNRKKRMKQLQKKIKAGKLDVNEDDPFELFISSTEIRYCYYKDTHKILGQTFGMCILQDFEAMTPNLLARTVETVEGGGLVILLLKSVDSLKQLYTMSMDVHERFRTEAHQNIVGRFNERFLLSLSSNSRCLVVDDQLSVLPLSSHVLNLEPVGEVGIPEGETELLGLKESLQDTQPVGALANICQTLDQARALLKFIEAISEKSLRSTVSLTAARGRGKSAALGLAIAGAIGFGYSNIFVTSPSPENLKTLFEFVFKGLDALEYQEHLDYDLVQSSNPEFNKAVVRVNIFRDHRQTIQYIHPTDAQKLGQAELLVIDEAAAIPLPYVKSLLGPYLVFLSSTINGYEGTGRSLSLKLLKQLRVQTCSIGENSNKQKSSSATTNRALHEVVLNESIRYKPGDVVEKWLTDLLCLDVTSVTPVLSGCPPPDSCELYYINRDTLFCYHKASEAFLHRIMALYVASHYKNTPNDLQLMSDAPAHHLFCLLGPVDPNQTSLPEVLVVVQVCLEGNLSKETVASGMQRGKKASGDLIPWNIADQFKDQDFPCLSGARIVRIATNPEYQGMGYGSRAIEILKQYYSLQIPAIDEKSRPAEAIVSVDSESVGLLDEVIEPRKSHPPLMLKLSERPAEKLDYIGVSFGLTQELLKFWKKSHFVPVYIRQTANELTGEHSCIMLSVLDDQNGRETTWLREFWVDFRRRFISLLGYQFRTFSPSFALSVLQNKMWKDDYRQMSAAELDVHFTQYDLQRLEKYCNNLVDYHLIMDLMPTLAKLHFQKHLGDTHISAVQAAILLGVGLQHRTINEISEELDVMPSQLLGLFNRTIRKALAHLRGIVEKSTEAQLVPIPKSNGSTQLRPTEQTLEQELDEVAKDLKAKQKIELELLKKENLAQYAIKGSEDDWSKILSSNSTKSMISIKSGLKRAVEESKNTLLDKAAELPQKKKKKKSVKK